MAKITDGCSFGKVTRNMMENLNNDFQSFKVEIRTEFKELRDTNTKLYNHLSNRLPPWAMAIGVFMAGILGSLVTYVLTK
jgi:hypothetical protein